MKYLENLYKKVIEKDSPKGYSLAEIAALQAQFGKSLPECYIEFLMIIGKKVRFLDGLSFSIEELINIKEDAKILVNENTPRFYLKENDFVFLMNEGYMFMFFNLLEGDNPPVYGFIESVNQQKLEKIADSLSEFFERVFLGNTDMLAPLRKFKNYN